MTDDAPRLAYKRQREHGYRIVHDGVEIGSVSLQERHTRNNALFWRWGVDVMPLMDHGGRPPSGEIDVDGDPASIDAGFHDALAAFKRGFAQWLAGIDPGKWRRNLEHKRIGQDRLRRLDADDA